MPKHRLVGAAFALALLFTVPLAAAPRGQLQMVDIQPGQGAEARPGDTVEVHYTGWLMDGTQFDSSHDRGRPMEITLGLGKVIPGWELGLQGMKKGGKRQLIIPPELAYGARRIGDVIPPSSTLKFEVELVEVTPHKFINIDNSRLAAMLKGGTKIVDIRRPEEWKKTGVVKGSRLITLFDKQGKTNFNFIEELTAFAKPDESVILICRTGNRTLVAAHYLTKQVGYQTVYNVKDGISRWIKDGNPVAACGSC